MAVGDKLPDRIARELEVLLGAVVAGQCGIHVPPEVGLYRRQRDSHFHFTPEVFFVTGGACDFECPGASFRVCGGEVCVMPRGVPHRETPHDLSTAYRTLVVGCHEEGVYLLEAGRGADGRPEVAETWELRGSRGRPAMDYLSDVGRLDGIVPTVKETYQSGLLQAFLSALLSDIADCAPAAEVLTPFVAAARSLARRRLSDPGLTVGSLAREMGVSADHLTRTFRRDCGICPAAWIASERVAAAMMLLSDPGQNISQVAWSCGFSSLSYFIRVFRSRTGLSPGRWRAGSRAAGG